MEALPGLLADIPARRTSLDLVGDAPKFSVHVPL